VTEPADDERSAADVGQSHAAVRPAAGPAAQLPLDEPWLDDATVADLHLRLERLTRLRGGRVAVRYTTGPSVVLALTARRRGSEVHVRAKNLGVSGSRAAPWRRRWVSRGEEADSEMIMRGIGSALGRLSPAGSGGPVSLRLEVRADARAWADQSGCLGWLVAIPVVGVAAVVVGESVPGSLAAVAAIALAGRPDWAGVLLIAAALCSAMLAALFSAELVRRLADARSWTYARGSLAMVVGAAVGCAAYLVVVIAAGSSWVLVVAVTLFVSVAVTLARRLRHHGGSRK
jgi:hypothetical protein